MSEPAGASLCAHVSTLCSDGRKRTSGEERDASSAAEHQSDHQGEQVEDEEPQTEG